MLIVKHPLEWNDLCIKPCQLCWSHHDSQLFCMYWLDIWNWEKHHDLFNGKLMDSNFIFPHKTKYLVLRSKLLTHCIIILFSTDHSFWYLCNEGEQTLTDSLCDRSIDLRMERVWQFVYESFAFSWLRPDNVYHH